MKTNLLNVLQDIGVNTPVSHVNFEVYFHDSLEDPWYLNIKKDEQASYIKKLNIFLEFILNSIICLNH